MRQDRKAYLLDLFNSNARIAKTTGMVLSYDEEGCARIDMPYNPGFDHAGEGIHGGIVATMLDNAGWFTCALESETGIVLTSDLSIHLLRPAVKAHLVARGELLKKGRRQSVAQMFCRDSDGTLIAHAVGTFTNLEPDSRAWKQQPRTEIKSVIASGAQ